MKIVPARLAEIEHAVRELERLGWSVEKLTVTDENGEDTRLMLKMRYGPPKKEDIL